MRLIKLVFGRLLHEYDIDWAGSESSAGREMPKGMCIEGMFVPNIKSEIRLRSRNV